MRCPKSNGASYNLLNHQCVCIFKCNDDDVVLCALLCNLYLNITSAYIVQPSIHAYGIPMVIGAYIITMSTCSYILGKNINAHILGRTHWNLYFGYKSLMLII